VIGLVHVSSSFRLSQVKSDFVLTFAIDSLWVMI
jgi:hypothetical protein